MKPIVFGNVARYFGKKREEDGHTHQWSVYVKPYRNEVRRPRISIITIKYACKILYITMVCYK